MKEILHQAMKYLSDVCDGAFEQDGSGFSKSDSYSGKYLAAIPTEKWGKEGEELAKFYSYKYRKQISHILDASDFRQSFPQSEADVIKEARRDFDKPNYACIKDGKFFVYTPYNASFVADGKKIPSRWYHSNDKSTSFGFQHVKEVIALCEKYGIEIEFDMNDVPAPKVAPTTTSAPQVTAKTVEVGQEGEIEVRFSYDYKLVQAVKSVGGSGLARWDKDGRFWKFEPIHAAKVIETLEPYGFTISDKVKELTEKTASNKQNYNLDTTTFRADIPGFKSKEYEVLPHQWVPVEQAYKENSLLLADSQGLGKTLISLVSMRIKGCKRSVVVCPASLTENWITESKMFFEEGTFTVYQAEGFTTKEIPEGTNLIVVSWSVFSKWKDALNAWKPDAIFVDEAHYGKSGKQSQRGKAYIEFGHKENPKAFKAVLTGTPILNRPRELMAALQFLGILKLFGGVTKFRNRYCGPKLVPNAGKAYPVYTYDGATNLVELNDILTSSGTYMRRTKQLLKQQGLLKNKYVNGVEFFDYKGVRKPTQIILTPEEWKEYEKVEQDLRDNLVLKRKELAIEMGLHENHPYVYNALSSNKSGEALQLLSEFRKRIGLLKVRAIKEKVHELVAKGEKVVIFAHHREVVDAYANEFSGIKIQGGMGTKKIEEAKRLFNATTVEEHPVLVVSIEAGKTGHTLCLQEKNGVGKNCAYSIFAEEPYVYGDYEQAEDRIYRIGQTRDVYIMNMIVPDTVDEVIYEKREKKRAVFNSIIDGVNIEEDSEENIAKQILKGYL